MKHKISNVGGATYNELMTQATLIVCAINENPFTSLVSVQYCGFIENQHRAIIINAIHEPCGG